MSGPAWRSHRQSDRRFGWMALVGACLLVSCRQAGDLPVASAQSKARDYAWTLMRRVHDEVGPAAHELRDAGVLVTLGLAETRGNPLQHGEWLEAQWFYYLLNDDHARARDAIAASRQQAIAAHAGSDRIADVTSSLSYSLILLGEIAKAKEYLRQAIVLASQRHDRVLMGDLYFSIGDAYRKTGERLIARRYFEAAYEIDGAAGDESQQRVSELRLGSLARDAGDYQEAVRRHEQALVGFRREGKYRELVTQIELARDHAALNNFALAEQYANAAMRDRRALLEVRMDAKILLLRVANDRRTAGRGTPADAQRAAGLVREIEGMIAKSAGEQRSEFSHPTRQLQFYEQALRHDALGADLARVDAHGRRAIRLLNQVATSLRTANDDSLAWLSGAQPLLNEYVNAVYRLNREQVFPLLEAYYGQPVPPGALRHSGVVGRAFETQAVALFERYRAAQQELIDATAEAERLKELAGDARDGVAPPGLERRLLERDLARDAYLALYSTQPATTPLAEDPDAAAYGFPSLPAGDVLIRYFVQEQVSFGVVLAGKRVEYFGLPPRSAVIKLIQRALDVVEKPTDGDFNRAPLAAIAQLLPPGMLAQHGQATRLIIVPDDAMQPVPFAAIDIAEPAQPYTPLGARFELIRTKSATRYYANVPAAPLHRERGSEPADIAIFANPLLNAPPIAGVHLGKAPIPRWVERLPRLPNTQEEARRIAQTFAARHVETYLDADATNDALLSPGVRAARVLHIATHGYFSSSTPDLVGLATSATMVDGKAEGGFLGLTELFTEPFTSRLVVISGCETMRGRDYTGWGVRSLADGFLTQGAGSVIGTLWSVSDEATAALMGAFYRELSRNRGNSSLALRAARRELLESKRYRHPYYWAGIVLESSNRAVDQHVL